jgi:hypothetical protein
MRTHRKEILANVETKQGLKLRTFEKKWILTKKGWATAQAGSFASLIDVTQEVMKSTLEVGGVRRKGRSPGQRRASNQGKP